MTQQSGSQFEDDLTMGIDEDASFATDSIDLLGIGGNENSPIARLKTIILSIDWEINDDILQQLDDELHDLSGIWASDKIKQVYVQGLSKIGRYIYKEKASSHPNSIKLLVTFYHNLEKIVTNEDSMSEDEKKQLLMTDVKKFDQLKSQIAQPEIEAVPAAVADVSDETSFVDEYREDRSDLTELKALKAQVLGIDWEINDREIEKLGNEVKRLESVFSQSKAKLILLQGIGALSAYINKKRSQSNSGVFTLLHSFYASLEEISGNNLTAADEKKLLLSEVSKFNVFKTEIAKDKDSPAGGVADAGSTIHHADSGAEPVPALSDSPGSVSDDFPDTKEELLADDAAVAADVTSRLTSVFGEEDEELAQAYHDSDGAEALAGVDVETEADDDSAEEALPYQDGTVAPALTDADEDLSFSVEKLADDLSVAPPTVKAEAIVGDDIEDEDDFPLDNSKVQQVEDISGESIEETGEKVLPGVDVETVADDDSEEESLPMEGGELAPALSDADDESGFNAARMASEFDKSDSDAIEDRLGDFFDDEVAISSEGWVSETSEELIDPDDSDSFVDDGIVAALSEVEDEPTHEEEILEDSSESESGSSLEDQQSFGEDVQEPDLDLSIFDDDEPIPALSDSDDEIFFEDTKSDNDEQESIVDGLSFLDDDIDEEIDDSQENIEESLSFLDDDPAVLVDADPSTLDPGFVEDPLGKEVALEVETETLTVFDDDTELEEPVAEEFTETVTAVEPPVEAEDSIAFEEDISEVEPIDDDISFEVITDDIEDDDEIEFTVPGEAVVTVTDGFAERVDGGEEIEFSIPGEITAPTVAVATGAVTAAMSTTEPEINAVTDVFLNTEKVASKAVVFEVVGDDESLDLLPGETFDDSVIVEKDPSTEEVADFEAVEEELDTGKYESLAMIVAAVQENAVEEGVQDVLSELNRLRSSPSTGFSDKTFLQLLSTVSQFVEKNRESLQGLELMQEIVSGLEMSDSSKISDDVVQEKLFTCTSKILLLQVKEVSAQISKSDAETNQKEDDLESVDSIPETEESLDTEKNIDTENYTPMGEDAQLASFVQQELADIRKLFVEEIGSLRKELAGK